MALPPFIPITIGIILFAGYALQTLLAHCLFRGVYPAFQRGYTAKELSQHISKAAKSRFVPTTTTTSLMPVCKTAETTYT